MKRRIRMGSRELDKMDEKNKCQTGVVPRKAEKL